MYVATPHVAVRNTSATARIRITRTRAPEEVAFGAIIDATPRRLKELGLYGPLAIEWRDGAHRTLSVQLVALALGATTGGVCDVGTLGAARAWRAMCPRGRRRRRLTQLLAVSQPGDAGQGPGGSVELELKLDGASSAKV